MPSYLYVVESSKPFDETVEAVERKTAEKGFRVLHTHDVAATLAEKGFPREPMKIIEVCNARYASEALNKDIRLAVMLPCPICVYAERGKTLISTFRPSAIPSLFPESDVATLAAKVDRIVLAIVDEAKE
ncbi:MAG TPA: DUF302 domain-containing protein [Candidatus Acidoferrales bacterium]|nr:DUF302 domain-containing protein [Candidatus Acidoferrales bacterium]